MQFATRVNQLAARRTPLNILLDDPLSELVLRKHNVLGTRKTNTGNDPETTKTSNEASTEKVGTLRPEDTNTPLRFTASIKFKEGQRKKQPLKNLLRSK